MIEQELTPFEKKFAKALLLDHPERWLAFSIYEQASIAAISGVQFGPDLKKNFIASTQPNKSLEIILSEMVDLAIRDAQQEVGKDGTKRRQYAI